MALISRIPSWLVSTQGTAVACGLIAALALGVYLFYFWPRARRLRRSLIAARAELEQTADEAAFAAQFEDLHRTFQDHEVFGHAWKEFVDSLVSPGPEESRPVFRNSHQAAEYFNAASIIESQFNLRFVQSMPGYLTGAGILGTFIGLAAGIWLASAGLAAQEIEETRRSLSHLLNGASLAFLTSVVGLSASLIFSLLEKKTLHQLDQQVELWNAAIDRRLRRVTPEQLAAEQIREAAKQTLQLERFNTDLAVSIAGALEQRLSVSFAPKINQVIEGLHDLKGQQSEFSTQVLEAVTTRISDALSGAAGTEMRQMAETLRGLVQILREAAGALSSGQAQMAQLVQDVIGRLEASFGQNAAALSTETTRAIEKVVQYMDAAGAATSKQLTSAADAVSSKLEQAASQLTVTLEAAGGTAAGRLEVAGGRLASELERAGQHTMESLRSAGDLAAERLGAASGETVRQFTEVGAVVTGAATSFRETAERLTALHNQHGTAVTEIQALLRDLRDLHGSMRLAVQPLADGVQGLRSVNSDLASRLQEMGALQQALTRAAEDVSTAQRFMQQAWAQYEGRFSSLDASLEGTFTQFKEGLELYSATIRTYVVEIEKSFTRALQELGTVLKELDETVEELGRQQGV